LSMVTFVISMIKRLTLLLCFWLHLSYSQTTLNAYAKITSVTNNSVLALSNVNIANHTFTVGGQVIIMQMQDDVIGTNTTNASSFGDLSSIANAGRYEIRTISAVTPTSGTPTSVTITPALSFTYNTGANSSVQMISFRDLGANYTTTANISGLTWDGNVGGVVAFYVTNTLTLNHRVLADGLGFRGGLYSNNNNGPVCTSNSNTLYLANNNQLGYKGEGIYKNTNNTFNNARGKILSGGGGGNDHNAGGGGGGNYTAGGLGGNGYNNCTGFPGGGLGAISLSVNISASRVFMGGGGGGGQQNNSQNSAGGNGGGIILIKANTIATSTTCASSIQISADGLAAIDGGNDGMGGGGAGGSIVIEAGSFTATATCPLTVTASGRKGGNVNNGTSHGGGGGGGQGAVIYSSAQPTLNISTITNNGVAGFDNSGGSTSAGPGSGTNGTGIIAASGGPLPITLLFFKASKEISKVKLDWSSASEKNNAYYTVERSEDGLHFSVVGTLAGESDSKTRKDYVLYDYTPLSGLSYYRLKQTDYDGSYSYSPIVVIQMEELPQFEVYPNPLDAEQRLLVSVHNTAVEALNIYTPEGVDITSQLQPVYGGDSILLSREALKPGIYFIKVTAGGRFNVKKLIVK
jgi:hypothetical protein